MAGQAAGLHSSCHWLPCCRLSSPHFSLAALPPSVAWLPSQHWLHWDIYLFCAGFLWFPKNSGAPFEPRNSHYLTGCTQARAGWLGHSSPVLLAVTPAWQASTSACAPGIRLQPLQQTSPRTEGVEQCFSLDVPTGLWTSGFCVKPGDFLLLPCFLIKISRV